MYRTLNGILTSNAEDAQPIKRCLDVQIRDDGVCGVLGNDLLAEDANIIGRAFGSMLQQSNSETVCACHDGGDSSELLYQYLVSGLIKSGMHVVSLGECIMPVAFHAIRSRAMDSGVMITSIDNQHWFEFCISTIKCYGDKIREIVEIASEDKFIESGRGREIILNNCKANYIQGLCAAVSGVDNLKVAWYVENACCASVINALSSAIRGQHHLLSEAVLDGQEDRLQYLSKFVVYNSFDIGFYIGANGAQLSVVNNKGHVLSNDQILEVFAYYYLKKNPGAQVVCTKDPSNSLIELIKSLGGAPVLNKGLSMQAIMQETGALLGGNEHGCFIFRDRWLDVEDAVYAALRALEIISEYKDAFCVFGN